MSTAPMPTRRRAAFLRRLGFQKAPFTLMRGTTTHKHPGGGAISFPTGAKPGAFFKVFCPHGRRLNFSADLLLVGNVAEGARQRLRELRDLHHEPIPDPDADDFMTEEWSDALFCGLATAISADAARRAESTPPEPAPF